LQMPTDQVRGLKAHGSSPAMTESKENQLQKNLAGRGALPLTLPRLAARAPPSPRKRGEGLSRHRSAPSPRVRAEDRAKGQHVRRQIMRSSSARPLAKPMGLRI